MFYIVNVGNIRVVFDALEVSYLVFIEVLAQYLSHLFPQKGFQTQKRMLLITL